MSGLSPSPLPVFGTLFDPAAGFGCGDAAPLPVFGTLFGAANASTLTAANGVFAVAGQVASLKCGHKISAANGSFTLAGQAASLSPGSETGIENAAPLPVFTTLFASATGLYILFPAPGAFQVTGTSTIGVSGRFIDAQPGLYTVSVPDGICEMQMTAAAGSATVAGEDAALDRAWPDLVAAFGAFTFAGADVPLVYSAAGTYQLIGQPGTFSVAGEDAALSNSLHGLTADVGTFTATGVDARLAAVLLAGHWAPVDSSSGTWTNITISSSNWNNA